MKNLKSITDVPSKDRILQFKQAMHLRAEAARDNIQVTIRVTDGDLFLGIGKSWYRTTEGALRAIQALQSQIAPSSEVRS